MSGQSVAVVGHCASGKSTVVDLLVQRGFKAYSVAQEHSEVRDLWRRQQPDLVLYLDVSLEELRRRRNNPVWPEWIYDSQTQRLEHARDHASLIVDTDRHEPEMVVDLIERHLSSG